ncbi:hypothetical protein D3C80_1750730 [compost metagenome]
MEAGNRIQRTAVTVHEVVAGSAVHMHIDESGNQQAALSLTVSRPSSIGIRQPGGFTCVMDLFS